MIAQGLVKRVHISSRLVLFSIEKREGRINRGVPRRFVQIKFEQIVVAYGPSHSLRNIRRYQLRPPVSVLGMDNCQRDIMQETGENDLFGVTKLQRACGTLQTVGGRGHSQFKKIRQ